MAEEDTFYMAVQNPKDFRREILEANKEIINLLQRHETLKQIRIEKLKQMLKFSEVMAEVSMLSNKLKRTVPLTKLKNMPRTIVKEEENKAYKDMPMKEKESNFEDNKELSALKKELELIESKLSLLDDK